MVAGLSTVRRRAPLADRAGLACPRELADKLPVSGYRASALRTCVVLIVLTTSADAVPPNDLLLSAHRHARWDVANSRLRKVLRLLKQRKRMLAISVFIAMPIDFLASCGKPKIARRAFC